MGQISTTFIKGIEAIREYEKEVSVYQDFFVQNMRDVKSGVKAVLEAMS